ncbi:cytochrome b-c1 complex subunit 7-like [Haemaphysalis longicornis]
MRVRGPPLQKDIAKENFGAPKRLGKDHLCVTMSSSAYKTVTAVNSWSKFMFKTSKYYQYGLLKCDLYRDEPVTLEAVRRLPKKIQDERNYRILRAVQCNIAHSILPESQWTKYEDDVPYLDPYIAEVEKEEAEKKEWYRTH